MRFGGCGCESVVADSAGKLFLIEFCDRLETKEGQSGGPACSFSLLHLVSMMTMGGPPPLVLREARTPTPAVLVFSRLFLSVETRNGVLLRAGQGTADSISFLLQALGGVAGVIIILLARLGVLQHFNL